MANKSGHAYFGGAEGFRYIGSKIKAFVERLLAHPAFANAIVDTNEIVARFEELQQPNG